MPPKTPVKRGAAAQQATPGRRAAPTHAPGTPTACQVTGEDPIDDDCERCALYVGTEQFEDCDAVFVEGQQKRYQRCANPKANHECRPMNKLMGAEYNRVLRAISAHERIMAEAGATPAAQQAASDAKDVLVEAWPAKLRSLQRNRANISSRNAILSNKKRRMTASAVHAISMGEVATEQAATKQALVGIFELGRAFLATRFPTADLTRADSAMLGLRACFEDKMEEENGEEEDKDEDEEEEG